MMRTTLVRALLALVLTAPAFPAAAVEDDPVLWPEHQRSFLLDGAGLLLAREERERLEGLPSAERDRFIEEFLADPFPETEENELREGIRRRRALVLADYVSLADDRARVLFLHGAPARRQVVDCGQVFVPLELWRYGDGAVTSDLVFYRPGAEQPYRLWLPLDSKRALYNPDMEYWLEQWEELQGRITGKRFDLQACPHTPAVDDATGVAGLRGFREDRPSNESLLAFLEPPDDLSLWARRAAATPLPETPPGLLVGTLEVLFPDRIRQRIVTRFLLTLPPEAGLEPVPVEEASGPGEAGGTEEVRLTLAGVIEQGGAIFDEFRVRFKLPPPAPGLPLALAFERPLRPRREFLLRFRLEDETSGAEVVLNRGFRVPAEPIPVEEPPLPEGVVVNMGEQLSLRRLPGRDSLLLAPPDSEVMLGLWRAEALVTGEAIQKVVFMVDGEVQLTRSRPPFTAELRLARFPREQVVRAEGYDAAGNLVAADEVVLNHPRGSFKVRIQEPPRGARSSGTVTARAEVYVPEDKRLRDVEFRLNEETVATLERPPWEARVEVPSAGEPAFLTVVATLTDGTSTEAVRYINAPRYLEEVEVQLVELLTTVSDRSRRPVADLRREDFEVYENKRRQQIDRFERVENLALTVGIAIDTSGSMLDSLTEAKRAATGFLQTVLGPRDKAFAVSFAKEPVLLVPPTDDVGAIEESLEDLQSIGWTALHDAVVSSLYYFRGFRGQRALIVLSDGDDSASFYPFRDALEYARRSGVVIYTVGLNVGSLKVAIRRKLAELAEETGGRVFFISRAEQLTGVYREIETELRSQYVLAYASDNPTDDGQFREVEVKIVGGKYKARTIRGYYP